MTDSDIIQGVAQGIHYGQYDRLGEINLRLYDRILATSVPIHEQQNSVPPNALPYYVHAPKFDIRSVPTRNCLIFPVLDMKFDAKTKIQKQSYSDNNIATESKLRNQHYALQHGADQSVYVPSSKSELYAISNPSQSTALLYTTTENPLINNSQIGKNVFNNFTKNQLRNISS